MPKDLHTQNGADAAADQSGSKKGGFRNAPGMMPGFLFIYPHQQKGSQIHDGQIDGD